MLEELAQAIGGRQLQLSSMYGWLVPVVTWIFAHGVVLFGMLTLRYGYALIQQRAEVLRDRDPEELAHRPLDLNWLRAVGCLVIALLFTYGFYTTVGLDSLLIRYFMISSSRPLKIALGDNWESLAPADMAATLKGSFVGQIILHAGAVYVLTILVAAFFIVIALHNFVSAINALPPRRGGAGGPPPLAPASPPSWRNPGVVTGAHSPQVNMPPPMR